MTASVPLVTIGLPTYNGAACVGRALASLLAQDYPNIELLIADDCSTDDTVSVCEQLTSARDDVVLQRNAKNLGEWGNSTNLLRQARGSYFFLASQDDWWDSRFVSMLADTLERNPAAIAALPAVRFTHSGSNQPSVIGRFVGKARPDNQSRLAILKTLFSKRSPDGDICRTTMYIHGLVRTRAFRAAVTAHPDMILHERQVLCHWAIQGEFAYVDEVLCEKTWSSLTVAQRHGNETEWVAARTRLLFPVRYAIAIFVGILRSSSIPSARKPWAFVCVWYYLVSYARKHAERALLLLFPKSFLQTIRRRRNIKRDRASS